MPYCKLEPFIHTQALEAQIATGVQRHNEVMLDTRSVEACLPWCVLGFFYIGSSVGDYSPLGGDLSSVRRAFREQYDLSGERAPLIRLDLSAETPFSGG